MKHFRHLRVGGRFGVLLAAATCLSFALPVAATATPKKTRSPGAQAFIGLKCHKCHSVSSLDIAPIKVKKSIVDLAGVGTKYKSDWFAKWLKKEVKKDSIRKKGKQVKHKTKFKGDAAQLKTLAAWLAGL